MSFTIKRVLIFPVELFVIWQQGKKSSEMLVYTSPIPASNVRCKRASKLWQQIKHFRY